jgi:hypothetical protein
MVEHDMGGLVRNLKILTYTDMKKSIRIKQRRFQKAKVSTSYIALSFPMQTKYCLKSEQNYEKRFDCGVDRRR